MKFKKIFIVGKCRLEFNFFPIKTPDEKIMTGINDIREEDEEIKFGNKLINFKGIQEEITTILTKEPKDRIKVDEIIKSDWIKANVGSKD